MKALILVSILLCSTVSAADIYGDIYRFGQPNFTGKGGLALGDYNIEYSFSDNTFAIGERKYLAFENIEFGIQAMVTNKVNDQFIDERVIDVEGGYHITLNPYFKAGSNLFIMVKLDESNKAVVQFGFNLF